MPKSYKEKQAAMLAAIKEQYAGDPFEGPLRVEMDLYGEGRGDIDNIIGAFFDTANKILWIDDRVTIITQVSASWQKASKAESKWLIRLYSVEVS